MIIKKTKQLINEFRAREEKLKKQNEKILAQNENLKKQNALLISQNAELEWANIYHDTISDKKWLKELSISPGRWAGNYSLFYLLARILSDYQPAKILELGLGESSKLVSSFLDNHLKDSKHLIVEQDEDWIESFTSRFELSRNSEIIYLPLISKNIKDNPVNSYSEIENRITESFDLYLVDGPTGSNTFSRYDICSLCAKMNENNEFIIIVDDYDRNGEKETVEELINKLTESGIKIFYGIYRGAKDQIVITSEKYRSATSL